MNITGEIKKSNSLICSNIIKKENVDGCVNRAETVYLKELEFANRFEFPTIGNSQMLYIAMDEKSAYIFNSDSNTYACIGRDYNQIEAIQCNLKE